MTRDDALGNPLNLLDPVLVARSNEFGLGYVAKFTKKNITVAIHDHSAYGNVVGQVSLPPYRVVAMASNSPTPAHRLSPGTLLAERDDHGNTPTVGWMVTAADHYSITLIETQVLAPTEEQIASNSQLNATSLLLTDLPHPSGRTEYVQVDPLQRVRLASGNILYKPWANKVR